MNISYNWLNASVRIEHGADGRAQHFEPGPAVGRTADYLQWLGSSDLAVR